MSLYPVLPLPNPDITERIAPDAPGAVYAYAVAEGIQSGMIFSDAAAQSLLVRHFCGFALLFGRTDEKTLRTAGDMILRPEPYARTVLFAPNEETAAYFAKQPAFALGRRLFFRLPETVPDPPETAEAASISPEILPQLSGRIVPSFSWDSDEAFWSAGSGFCVMKDGVPASWAFSAAVSARETDIGIETDPRFRRQGLAFAAASAMIRSVRQAGKMPVWACSAENLASAKLAAALGFEECGQCITVMRG